MTEKYTCASCGNVVDEKPCPICQSSAAVTPLTAGRTPKPDPIADAIKRESKDLGPKPVAAAPKAEAQPRSSVVPAPKPRPAEPPPRPAPSAPTENRRE